MNYAFQSYSNTMIADWQTDKIYFSEWLRKVQAFTPVCRFIEKELAARQVPFEYLQGTNDIWARDYMPVQVSADKFIEFRYDPDYLQGIAKYRRNYKTYPDIVCQKHTINTLKSGLIVDGGNVVKSGKTIIMTDKVFTENRYNFSKIAVMRELENLFETDKIVIVPWLEKDSDECGHTDGYVRFVDDDTVLVNHIYRNIASLLKPLQAAGFGIEKLHFDVKKEHRHNWAYLNFLQTRDLILVTQLGSDEDEQAFRQLSEYYSRYAATNSIVFVPGTIPILNEGGALNCISWTLKETLKPTK